MRGALMNHLRSAAGAVALALFAAACGGEEEDAATSSTEPIEPTEVAYGAQVASYDLAAGTPQRFLVGLLATDNALVVGGEGNLEFRYLGSNTVAGARSDEDHTSELQSLMRTSYAV